MTFRDVLGGEIVEGVPWHPHDGADISGEIVASTIRVIRLLGGIITAEESIIAGGILGILRSDNFVAGSSGRAWFGDGTFEAQDGIFRGTLNADDLVAGILDVDRIAVNTLQVSRLVLGSFDNLVTNPGFEVGDIASTNDPHNYVDAGPDGAWASRTDAGVRSGGRAAKFEFSQNQTAGVTLELNGTSASIERHHSATEGDVFTVQGWARLSGVAPATSPYLRVSWRDEDGTEISGSSSLWPTLTTNYQQQTQEATAPAGTAYAVFQAGWFSGDAVLNTQGAAFDDFYARRKVGTLIIEDQAVDIVRMLDPVFQGGTDTGDNDVSITSTMADKVTATITLPSWVGEANVYAQARLLFASMNDDSVTSPFTVRSKIAGSTADTIHGFVPSTNTAHTVTLGQFRNLTAPGSSISVAMGAKTTTGTSVNNEVDIVSVATGIR